jgi:hypothetical protein
MTLHFRVARPTLRLQALVTQYERGLGLTRLGAFDDHEGFDGVMLGLPGYPYHLEFTHHRGHSADMTPHPDQLLVFYLPELDRWTATCASMLEAGFREVPSYNPYWDRCGKTFEDLDGFRVVLSRSSWGE